MERAKDGGNMTSFLYLLYVSNRCRYCQELRKRIFTKKMDKMFDVHPIEQEDPQKIPEFLQKVPTLVVLQTGTVYSGRTVFDWLDRQMNEVADSSYDLFGSSAMGCSLMSDDPLRISNDLDTVYRDPVNIDTQIPSGTKKDMGGGDDLIKKLEEKRRAEVPHGIMRQ